MFIEHLPNDDESMLIFEETDPYFIFDFMAGMNISRSLNFYVKCDNAFDYTQPTRDISDAAYMYAPLYGRSIALGMNLDILN
jgi:outer membrane receptor for monomeric catechols